MKLGEIERKNENKKKITGQKPSDIRIKDFDQAKSSVTKLRTESTVKRIELEKIKEHPENKKLFSMNPEDVERLARNILERGFVGCILVYNNKNERESYTIFSGHKRYLAVKYLWNMYGQEKKHLEKKKADNKLAKEDEKRLKELEHVHNTIPVYVQSLSSSMTDKDIIKDLITSNTYNRVLKRWDYGNLVDYLYNEHINEKKSKGRFIENCAEIVGLHANTIYRYLAINRLGKRFMHLAYDNEKFPYTGLANSDNIRTNDLLKNELYRRLIVARGFARGNLEEFNYYFKINEDDCDEYESFIIYENDNELQKSYIEDIVYELNSPTFEQTIDIKELPKAKFTNALEDILIKNSTLKDEVSHEMLMTSGYLDIAEVLFPSFCDKKMCPEEMECLKQDEHTPNTNPHAPYSPKILRRLFFKMQKQTEQIIDSGIRQKNKKDFENLMDLKQIIEELELSITEIKKLLKNEE